MKKEQNTSIISPILSLLIICLVVTAALVVTYNITAPIIEQNKPGGDELFMELLPRSCGDMTEIDVAMIEGIEEVYEADNGEGYIFTATTKGFGGDMTVMCGIDIEGLITGIKVTEHTETPNLGDKAMGPEYIDQFKGEGSITIKQEEGKTQIDAITGATVTSDAIFRAVEVSLQQFHEMGGGA